jgi:hypothetical protein
MFNKAVVLARERSFYRVFRRQIAKDIEGGHFTAEEGEELTDQLSLYDGYADLHLAIVASKVALLFLAVSKAVKLVTANLLIEKIAAVDPRVSSAVIHGPGMLLMRLIPGVAMGIGVMAVIRMDSRYEAVLLHFCEQTYRRLGAGFLNPIFVRPVMKVLGWLARLEWSDIKSKRAYK